MCTCHLAVIIFVLRINHDKRYIHVLTKIGNKANNIDNTKFCIHENCTNVYTCIFFHSR